MTIEEAKKELRKAERELRRQQRLAASGLPSAISKAARDYEYWLTKLYMAWEKTK